MWQGTSKEEAFKVMTNVCRHLVITHVVAPVSFSGKGIKTYCVEWWQNLCFSSLFYGWRYSFKHRMKPHTFTDEPVYWMPFNRILNRAQSYTECSAFSCIGNQVVVVWCCGFNKSQQNVKVALWLFGVDVNKNSCAVVLLIKRWFLLNFNINVISLRR